MKRQYSGSAIPRHYIFVLQDGTIVVQWIERKVQDIMTGRILEYTRADFGHWVTDGELDKLKAAGRVEHYTQRYVWLYALPEKGRFGGAFETMSGASQRVRAFYITTALPKSQTTNVQSVLPSLNVPHPLQVKIHDERVAVYGAESHPFTSLQDAEAVLQELSQIAPELFQGASVAVFEIATGRSKAQPVDEDPDMELSLDTMLLALSDTTVTRGKDIVIVGEQYQAEKETIEEMLVQDLGMLVTRCNTAREAIPLLEDDPPHIVLLDLELPDVHGWTFIRSIREIRSLEDLCLFVVSDNPADEVFALKVARVQGYLSRPVKLRKLRQKIWLMLRDVEAESASD